MSIDKRCLFTSRLRLFIQRYALASICVHMCRFLSLARNRVELMINWCTEKSMFESIVPVFVMAYAFMLRLPSEALPIVVGPSDDASSFFKEGDTVVLELKRRKNKPRGSRLVRKCWCSTSPVCALIGSCVLWLPLVYCLVGHMPRACTWVVFGWQKSW